MGLPIILFGCVSDPEQHRALEKSLALPQRGNVPIELLQASAGIVHPRIALIIANTYVGSKAPSRTPWPALASTTEDASTVADALTEKGFKLVGDRVQKDVSRHKLIELLDSARSAAESQSGTVLLVYFSGHGFANGNSDYLVPQDTSGSPITAPSTAGVPLSQVFEHLQRKDSGINVVLVDACRSVEAKGSLLGSLVEEKNLPPRTFVGYATTYGATVNASGETGEYARAWVDAITHASPLETLASIHYKVASDVVRRTFNQQRPVFTAGRDLFPAATYLFGAQLDGLAGPERDASRAVRELLGWCLLPQLNRSEPPAHDNSPEVGPNGEIHTCVRQLAAQRPDVAALVKRYQGPDMMAAVVAQAAQEGDSFALLLEGLSDLTDSSKRGATPFVLRADADPIKSGNKDSTRSGWGSLIRAGKLGNPYAAFLAGEALLFSPYAGHPEMNFPKQDRELGVALLDQAQHAGLGEAALFLAAAYQTGLGVARNPRLARNYARLMIHEGLHVSLPQYFTDIVPNDIGLDCAFGKVGPKDGECASELLTWVSDTATTKLNGTRSLAGIASITLVQMHERAAPGDLIIKLGQNDPLSRFYVERAAREGDVDGEFYLGGFQEYGIHGYAENLTQAVYWYRQAAAQGSVAAAMALRRLGVG